MAERIWERVVCRVTRGSGVNRLLLVDGHNLLFQMFFGMPARIVNSEGRAIQGTMGFVGALLKIIRMTQPTHVLVVFDGEHENARTLIDADYKANRPDYGDAAEEDNPFSQLADIYAALDCMGVRHMETTDCEADDVIAAYALYSGAEDEVVISSFDSDYFQLITDRVSVLRYRGEKTVVCTPAYIRTKFGIEPSQYAEHKAMTGDAADNIRGVGGVGPKTAAALLAQFGSLEAILARAQEIARPSVRGAIIAAEERLRLNMRLIRLEGCAARPFALDALVYSDCGLRTREVLARIGLL